MADHRRVMALGKCRAAELKRIAPLTHEIAAEVLVELARRGATAESRARRDCRAIAIRSRSVLHTAVRGTATLARSAHELEIDRRPSLDDRSLPRGLLPLLRPSVDDRSVPRGLLPLLRRPPTLYCLPIATAHHRSRASSPRGHEATQRGSPTSRRRSASQAQDGLPSIEGPEARSAQVRPDLAGRARRVRWLATGEANLGRDQRSVGSIAREGIDGRAGQVFDVSAKRDMYGPGCGYNVRRSPRRLR